jgi:hypothetical protein
MKASAAFEANWGCATASSSTSAKGSNSRAVLDLGVERVREQVARSAADEFRTPLRTLSKAAVALQVGPPTQATA